MVPSKRFLTFFFLAVVNGSTALGLVADPGIRHSTHRVRDVGGRLKVITFHPESSFQIFHQGIDHPLTKLANSTIEDSTISFIVSQLKINASAIGFRTGYSAETASHAYISQDGIPFANAVANVAFNHDNKVVAFGSSFVAPKSIASSKPTITVETAISTAEKALDGKYNDYPTSIEYFAKDDGSVALTYVIQIRNEVIGTWYQAFVDAHSGELLSITDFVAHASYLVLPVTQEDLSLGFHVVVDPQDILASPLGWHSTGTVNTTATSGNNIVAFKGSTTSTTVQSSATLNFIYTQSPLQAPTVTVNVNAARVNAFYLGNTIHDFSYRYGFTEAASNFQTNNFGKGGLQNDPVTISVQDSVGTDNSDFATPPDGQSGQMRLFLWDLTTPLRDGALENDIVIHEYTHGITGRMTGGGTGRCLQTTEAAGLGEGWSDAMADWTEKNSSAVADYFMGDYITNCRDGIRAHPYSTSATTNPLRYSSVKALNEIHNIGEVWANMLHNVYASLIGAHSWSSTARTNPSGTEGNIVFLHLFIDALPLPSGNPIFGNYQ